MPDHDKIAEPDIRDGGSVVDESTRLRQGLEAVLFLADEPQELETIAAAVDADIDVVESQLSDLALTYERDHRGFQIRQTDGRWRMYSADDARPVLERWASFGKTGRLTQAALETLAVIAYKQPISRQEIGEIRGVNADGAVRSLVARSLVQEVGRDNGPGQALLYGTTTIFLERLGLSSLSDLPPLTDFLLEAPAPDEPALGQLKEIRRRLAAGEHLSESTRGSGNLESSAVGNHGGKGHQSDEEELLPPMRAPSRIDEGEFTALNDQLERAARSAADRLKKVTAAEHHLVEKDVSESASESPSASDSPNASDGKHDE